MHGQRLFTRLFATAVLAGGLSLTSGGCTAPARSDEQASAPAPRRVVVAAVQTTDVTRQVRLSGVTRARNRARLSFPIGERVLARPMDVGDRFRRGDVLARLDARQLGNGVTTAAAGLEEIEVRLDQQRRELERTLRLFEVKAATQEDLERAEAGLAALNKAREGAESRLAEARRLSGDAVLRAPFGGTVTAVYVEPGELAAPGQPILEISGDGPVEVEIEVPETLLRALPEGLRTRVVLPLVDREVEGTVRSVASAAPGPGRLFPAVVALDEADGLRGGLTAEVSVDVREESALTVPVAAVINPGGGAPGVLRLRRDGGRTTVERVEVEVLGLQADRVALAGALRPEDQVLVAGHSGLANGEEVEVAR